MTNPVTKNLISAPDIAREMGWDRQKVHGILEFHGCLPKLETPYGRGVLRFYDKSEFKVAVARYEAAKRPPSPPPQPEPAPQPAAPAKVVISFDEIHEALAEIEKRSIERDRQLAAKIDAIATGVNLLLDHLTKPKDGPGLLAPPFTVTCAADSPPSPVQQLLMPQHNPAQASPARDTKPNIVIAGLLPSQAALISAEYETGLKLRFYTSDQASTSGFVNNLRTADLFISMVGFVNHKTENAAKTAGVKLVRIPGGMTRLREALHKIVMEGVDALP